MPLPSPEQLSNLNDAISKFVKPESLKGRAFAKVKAFLERGLESAGEFAQESAKFAMDTAMETGLKAGGVALKGGTVQAGGVAIMGAGMVGLAPISSALGPWITVAKVAGSYKGVSDLHDLVALAKKASSDTAQYCCRCGKCDRTIQYIVDKQEWKASHAALAAATFGIWGFVKAGHSGFKRVFGTSKKAEVSKLIVESAREGCTVAIATIFLRVSGNVKSANKQIAHVVAILCSEDGWNAFKDTW